MFRLNEGMQQPADFRTTANPIVSEQPEAQLKRLQRQQLQHAFENRSAQERARKEYQQLLLQVDQLHIDNFDNPKAVEAERDALMAQLDEARAAMQEQHQVQKQLSEQLKQLRARTSKVIRSAQFAAASRRLARFERNQGDDRDMHIPSGLAFS